MKKTSFLISAALFGSFGAALADPLKEAKINQIVNDVKVVDPQKGARPAVVQDTVRDQIAVRTGIQSRAELVFQDATLTRLGAETFFSFKAGTRDLSLERGTLLLQVPKNRGGARIRTASVTASITGTTIMIEHEPGKSLKVLVLEGSLRLSANGRFGESIILKPGKMVIMKPNATRIPDPIDVDLRKVMNSSALVNPALFSGKPGKTIAALPSVPLIEAEIARQDVLLRKKSLVRTNLLIPGAGTKVLLASDETLAQLELTTANARNTAPATSPLASNERKMQAAAVLENRAGLATTNTSGTSGTTGGGTNTLIAGTGSSSVITGTNSGSTGLTSGGTGTTSGGAGTPSGGTGGAGTTVPTLVDLTFTSDVDQDTFAATGRLIASGSVASRTIDMGGAIEVDGALTARGAGAVNGSTYTIKGSTIRAGGGLSFNGGDPGQTILGTLLFGPQAGGDVQLHASRIEFSTSAINGATLNGADAVLLGSGGDGGTLRIGSSTSPIAGDVIFNAPVTATTGMNRSLVGDATGGTGGTVTAVANGQIRVNSPIKVSESATIRTSNAGGNISLESALNSDQAIRIESSGQLLSLLDGAIATGPGGTIKLKATAGGIEVDGGTIRADRGSVQVLAPSTNGKIDLTNANIRGDTVKIGALGANGQLIIGGGTINADSTLKLYGGSTTGGVRFKDDVTLGGNSTKIIAGRTVQIDNGRTVTIGGSNPATVHTNSANYTGSGGNGSTTGQFGGAGATTQSYGSRPAF